MIVIRKENKTIFDTNTGILCRGIEKKPSAPELIDLKITNKCEASCNFCLVAGTKILTPNGEISIEDIKVGDIVYAYNEENNRRIETKVLEKYIRKYDGLIIVIELENGEKLELTPEHKIYVKNKGWIFAKEIETEDDLLEF
jgi:intein/homing endonuclease